jgi:RNA polymerase sigma-70 factor (ECF subfamily)
MNTSHVYSISTGKFGDFSEISGVIEKAKNGDNKAFSDLYNLYFKKIYTFIYYRVSHKETAEDLAEDVFLKAYTKIASVSKNASFEGWLYQIARNLVIDYYRQKKSDIDLKDIENTLEYESNIINEIDLNAQQKVFLTLLKELTPEHQQIIRLKFIEDLDNFAIAQILEKTEGAVRVLQHRALASLKDLVSKLKNHEQE